MSRHEIGGVFCAAATPIGADDTPDHAAFADHAKALLDEGCHGIALLGTTGEANSFGVSERMTILDKAIDNGLDPKTLLPGTSQTSVTDTIALTKHAAKAGVRAVLLLPPFYYKGVSEDGLFDFYSRVIDGVAEDGLRVILYHIPPIAVVGIPHTLIARLREAYPRTVLGIKDSSGDIANMEAMAKAFHGFGVLSGADPFMLPLLKAGGAGCITSSSNLIAGDLRIVFEGFDDPAKAEAVEKAQARINAWRNLSNAYVQLPTVKAMVARRRGNDVWLKVRPPLVALTETQRQDVWSQMERLEA